MTLPAPVPSAGDTDLRDAVSRLARGASIEITARQPEQVAAWLAPLPAGTEVFIAWVPGTPLRQQADVAVRVRAAGMEPVPHIAARQLASAGDAAELLARLRGDAQVTKVLAIAGDAAAKRGAYPSSLELIDSGLFAEHGIRHIAAAGYPEGHPAIADAELLAALRRKVTLAAEQHLALSIVSQFAFDGAAVLAWVSRLRGEGIAAPLRVGVAGPATLRTLISYGMRCGVGNSLRLLGSHTQSLANLLRQHGPDAVVAAIAAAPADLGVTGLHLFPFGGVSRSTQWLAAAREGTPRPGT